MTRVVLSAGEIRARLLRAWQDRPDDPAAAGMLSFGEGLALQQEADAFNVEMAASGSYEEAERCSREAGELVMRLAREVEAACGY